MARYEITSLAVTRDEYFRLHRAGCKDSKKERGVKVTLEAPNAAAAAADYIDDELAEMGYGVEDVKVLPCAK